MVCFFVNLVSALYFVCLFSYLRLPSDTPPPLLTRSSSSYSQQREPPGPLQLQYNAASHHVTPGPSGSDVRLAIAAAAHNHQQHPHHPHHHQRTPQHHSTTNNQSSSSSSSGGGGGGGAVGGALVHAKDYSEETVSNRANQRRQEQYRQVRAHVQKEDGRLHAYGWSLPGTKTNPMGTPKAGGKMPKVPAPVYCSPLAEASPHMKVFCAAGVNLNGGYTRDGGCIVSWGVGLGVVGIGSFSMG